MSNARGSSDRLKSESPRLRTCTRSAFRFARRASATSFSTWALDLMASLNPSTHIARYWGGPYTMGLGVGEGEATGEWEGETRGVAGAVAAACGPGPQPLKTTITTQAGPRWRLTRSPT